MKPKNSIGLISKEYSSNKVKIYEAYNNDRKIRDFKTNDDLKPLIDLIGKWRYFIGVRENLTKEELFMNITFIRENFSELNLVDIEQAINLSIKGDLEVDIEHYQSFTPLYIAKILNAYKSYRSSLVVDIRKKLEKIDDEDKPPLGDKERLALAKNSLRAVYKNKSDESFHDFGSIWYNFVKKNDLMKFTKELVDEALEFGKKYSSNEIRNAFMKDVINNSHNNTENARLKRESMERQSARNFVVRKWLNSIDDVEKFIETMNINMI